MVKAVEKTRPFSSRHGSSSTASPLMDISDEEKTRYRANSDLRLTEDLESSWRRIKSHKKRIKYGLDRRYLRLSRSISLFFDDKSIPVLKFIVPVNAAYRAAVDYRSYRLIDKSQHCDEYFASETHMMRKKIDVQMTDDSCKGN